jgi:hypothetical protein
MMGALSSAGLLSKLLAAHGTAPVPGCDEPLYPVGPSETLP